MTKISFKFNPVEKYDNGKLSAGASYVLRVEKDGEVRLFPQYIDRADISNITPEEVAQMIERIIGFANEFLNETRRNDSLT